MGQLDFLVLGTWPCAIAADASRHPKVTVSRPRNRHGVSSNASKTKPAKLLAVFVVDTNETELTIPFGTGF